MYTLHVTSPKNPTCTHAFSYNDPDTVVAVFTGLLVSMFVGANGDDEDILYDLTRKEAYYQTKGLTENEQCTLLTAVRRAVELYRQ